MTKRLPTRVMGLWAALLVSCGGSEPRATHVLLITADTTRVDDLGVYGGVVRTPHLQALREDGVLFDRAYSVAFGTTPSHASLFTSSYARDHGVYDNKTILGEASQTLAEIAESGGMQTAAFVSSIAVGRRLGLSQGFATFDNGMGAQRRGDATVDRFVAWLPGVNGQFFAWIHLMDPHSPYAPPAPFAERYLPDDPDLPTPATYGSFNQLLRTKRSLIARGVFERHDRIARGLYRGEIEFMDQQVGRAIDSLKQHDLYHDTAIVFISDHGENFGDPDPLLAFTHGWLHKHVVHLPLIVKLPNSRWAGDRRDFLVANIDIAPTLVDLLGLRGASSWRGRSLLPALAGERANLRDHVILESTDEWEISVRTERWAYRRWLRTPQGKNKKHLAPLQLFDLASDPEELHNVYGSADPETQAASERLARISREFLSEPGATPGATLDTPEHIEALRELGYIE